MSYIYSSHLFLFSVKALFAREQSGPLSRILCAGPKLYDKLQLYRRTLGHLSAVYCVLFDRTGRYIITVSLDLDLILLFTCLSFHSYLMTFVMSFRVQMIF